MSSDQDLKKAIETVTKELDKTTFKDDVDLTIKENVKKRRKLCENNHIVEIVSSRRKYCDRPDCKALLKEQTISNTQTNLNNKEYSR
mgnify:CR=1 FL=1